MHERRRQQELRRQIHEKEKELETLSNNRERLRLRQSSSRGSQNGRNEHTYRGVEAMVGSDPSSVAAFSYKRESSYKRDSNSPLRRSKESM